MILYLIYYLKQFPLVTLCLPKGRFSEKLACIMNNSAQNLVSVKHPDTVSSRNELKFPMLWFVMMLMPTGPPAMKLITKVQVSDADEEDEHKIAKILTVRYTHALLRK